jgi:hypothetical protein
LPYHHGQCSAITKRGKRCEVGSEPGSQFCHIHLGKPRQGIRPAAPEQEYVPYKDYISGSTWAYKRQAIRNVHSALGTDYCAACHTDQNLDVHHLTYERLGKEHVDDVCLLCRPCHEVLHAIQKGWEWDLQTAFRAVVDIRARWE